MKNRKIGPQFILYAQLVFGMILFVFLLFSALGRNPLSAMGVALFLLICQTFNSYAIYSWLAPWYSGRDRVAEMERTQLQTELRFLKSQLSPRFLFNTINDVHAFALSGSPKAAHALPTLNELLRYLLYECNASVPLRKEVRAIESYIALLQLRYEGPLNIHIDNGVRSADLPIEPMLLIPLLENACKHSGIGVLPDAFIRIDLREEAGLLTGHFINSRSSPAAGGNGVGNIGGTGLQNIRKRLSILQPRRPEENLVILESPEVFEVFIKIPGT